MSSLIGVLSLEKQNKLTGLRPCYYGA